MDGRATAGQIGIAPLGPDETGTRRFREGHAEAGAGDDVGGLAHGFGAAGDDHIGITGLDGLGGQSYAFQTGTADFIDGGGGDFLGDPGVDGHLAGHVLAKSRGQNIAEDDFIHLGWVQTDPVQGAFEGGHAQGHRGYIFEHTAETADGCSLSTDDNDFFQTERLLFFKVMIRTRDCYRLHLEFSRTTTGLPIVNFYQDDNRKLW